MLWAGLRTLFRLHSFPPEVLFPFQDPIQGLMLHWVVMFPGSSHLCHFLSLLYLHDADPFKESWLGLWWNVLQFGCIWCFLGSRWSLCIFEKNTPEVVFLSVSYQEYMVSICFMTGDINLYHLVMLTSIIWLRGFSTSQLLFFLL